MEVNLWHLANRIITDERLKRQNPDKADYLNERIQEHKENIVKCILDNHDNPILKDIILK